jgi:hypothetical protein
MILHDSHSLLKLVSLPPLILHPTSCARFHIAIVVGWHSLTASRRRAKDELEAKLREVEAAIDKFNKKIVYITA